MTSRITESDVVDSIFDRFGMRDDLILLVNRIGMAAYKGGARVPYGLIKGASDLIGWFIYRGMAIFLALECKRPGELPSEEQLNFVNQIRAAGGIAGVVESADQVEFLISFWITQREARHPLPPLVMKTRKTGKRSGKK